MTSETTGTAEHATREGAPPNDGPIGGAPGPSAETDRAGESPGPSAETDRAADAPSGLPDEDHEATPLGTEDEAPEGDAEERRGADDMPGIPSGGEPPTAG